MTAPSIVMKRYRCAKLRRLIPSINASQSTIKTGIETGNAESEARMNAALYSAPAF